MDRRYPGKRPACRVGVSSALSSLPSGVVGGRRHTGGHGLDEELADRIRSLVQDEPRLFEQRMFGGLAFLINGHRAVAASGQDG